MKFFITEQQRKMLGSTCFFEFQSGKYVRRNVFWQADSWLLPMNMMDQIQMQAILPTFQYYGVTVVGREMWRQMQQSAREQGGMTAAVIEALAPWCKENFRQYSCFTILGI